MGILRLFLSLAVANGLNPPEMQPMRPDLGPNNPAQETLVGNWMLERVGR